MFIEIEKHERRDQLSTRPVLFCRLHSPKNASGVMKLFSTKLPLGEYNLLHMKRIRKDDFGLSILLCPRSTWLGIREAVRNGWMEEFGLSEPEEIAVPTHPPSTKEDVLLHTQWPQNFHDPKPTEELLPPTLCEQRSMLWFMWAAVADGMSSVSGEGGVLVDPITQQVLVSSSQVEENMRGQTHQSSATEHKPHPLHTVVMLCIQGQSWIHQQQRGHPTTPKVHGNHAHHVTTKRQRHDNEADEISEPERVHFGNDNCLSHLAIVPWSNLKSDKDSLGDTIRQLQPNVNMDGSACDDNYLCTGLDMYVTHEPTPMYV
jgi:hypothetical protein